VLKRANIHEIGGIDNTKIGTYIQLHAKAEQKPLIINFIRTKASQVSLSKYKTPSRHP